MRRLRRLGRAAVGLTMTSCLALTVPTAVRAAPATSAERPAPESSTPEAIQRLHRRGDALFADKDFTGARESWLLALERVDPGPGQVAYRTTLLSLVTSATLEAYASGADASLVAETIDRLEDFAATDEHLTDELRTVVADDIARLRDVAPDETDESIPAPVAAAPVVEDPPPPVVVADPVEPDEPADVAPAPVEPRDDTEGPRLRRRGIILTSVGGVLVAGGLAALIAGTRFRPRALDAVDDFDDPPDREADFVDTETAKGRAWIGAGAGVAAVGTALVIVGIVSLVRARRASSARVSRKGLGWGLSF